jgi:ketopantoate reductase
MSRVAVLGAGGIGCGAAALLSENGHAPMLWSPSGRGTAAFADGSALRAEGRQPLSAIFPKFGIGGAGRDHERSDKVAT